MIWQAIAEEQMHIIEKLVELCDELIEKLAQYKNIEDEERRLRELDGEK